MKNFLLLCAYFLKLGGIGVGIFVLSTLLIVSGIGRTNIVAVFLNPNENAKSKMIFVLIMFVAVLMYWAGKAWIKKITK